MHKRKSLRYEFTLARKEGISLACTWIIIMLASRKIFDLDELSLEKYLVSGRSAEKAASVRSLVLWLS